MLYESRLVLDFYKKEHENATHPLRQLLMKPHKPPQRLHPCLFLSVLHVRYQHTQQRKQVELWRLGEQDLSCHVIGR